MICAKIATDGVDSPTLNDSDVLISYEGCGCAGGLVTTGYRVFSSVLGGELVSIETDQTGERRKVKVYAAEAVVGERSQRTLTGQSPTQTFAFFHADPLTGETGGKVFDALGQVVETTLIEDPDPEPFPPPENLRPGFSEWRCNVAAAFGQTFYEMPNDCRKAFHNETWKVRFVKKEGDATAISKTSLGHHESLHTFDRETSASDTVLNQTIRSTDKPDTTSAKSGSKPDCPKGQEPMLDADGTWQCVGPGEQKVEVNGAEYGVRRRSSYDGNSYGTWVDMESIIIRRDPDEAAQIAAYIRNLRLDDERSSLSTLNTLNNACSTLSIAQLNYQNGKWWRGLNGKWYYGLTGRGPNQYTGPRHHALNRAKLLRGLGKATFASGTALTSLQVGTGEVSVPEGTLDVTMGAVGAFGGPKGMIVSGMYFGYKAIPSTPSMGRPVSTNKCHRESSPMLPLSSPQPRQ